MGEGHTGVEASNTETTQISAFSRGKGLDEKAGSRVRFVMQISRPARF